MSQFIEVMKLSKKFHYPFAKPPQTEEDFTKYFERSLQENQKSYIINDASHQIIGVFNINEIVRGYFQSGYLGFYVNKKFAGKGLMSEGLKLVLNKIFQDLKLHRIEANIQPANRRSIQLVIRNGFIKEGFSQRYLKVNNQWCDHFRYALTYEDWSNSKS